MSDGERKNFRKKGAGGNNLASAKKKSLFFVNNHIEGPRRLQHGDGCAFDSPTPHAGNFADEFVCHSASTAHAARYDGEVQSVVVRTELAFGHFVALFPQGACVVSAEDGEICFVGSSKAAVTASGEERIHSEFDVVVARVNTVFLPSAGDFTYAFHRFY